MTFHFEMFKKNSIVLININTSKLYKFKPTILFETWKFSYTVVYDKLFILPCVFVFNLAARSHTSKKRITDIMQSKTRMKKRVAALQEGEPLPHQIPSSAKPTSSSLKTTSVVSL